MTQAVQTAQLGNTNPAWRNRIINGGMTIDQRNAGASVTVNNNGYYSVDRFALQATNGGSAAGGVYTAQQSTTAPSGFNNSLLLTVTTADAAPAAGDTYRMQQGIEGYNVADLGWGASGASTVTLSFWVRSSVTGTFAGGMCNSAGDRSYIFTYVINAANTWEQKTVTISGDVTGTWNKTNGAGIYVEFDLGSGSTYQGTANTWQSGFVFATAASTKLLATNGATFYITGVQLEVGTAATSFEFRDYGRELIMCQRYYETLIPTTSNLGLMLFNYSPAGNYWGFWDMKVEKRTTATVALTASGSWVNATPTIYPGITTVSFQYNAGTQPYLSGTSGTPALYASAEL